MLDWEKEIRQIEDDIKKLELKLKHPHLIRVEGDDYDIKSEIIRKQTEIISIYLRESQRLLHHDHAA
jgi:hypothetical protein